MLPEGHPRAGQSCPVFGFVIHHPQGPVLVDTGVGSGHEGVDRLFQPIHHPLDRVLGSVGIRPEEVVMVVNSHLHFDHCGNNRAFPGAPLVCQRAEYDLAHQSRYTISQWVDFPGARWQLVEGQADVFPGVTVLPTPGHTPGHQSVVVQDGSRLQVIAAQAVYNPEELDAETSSEPLSFREAEATSASAREVKALRPSVVYFSHDPRRWP